MSTKIPFPSTQWFDVLAKRMTADAETLRRLGPVDCTMVVKVGT